MVLTKDKKKTPGLTHITLCWRRLLGGTWRCDISRLCPAYEGLGGTCCSNTSRMPTKLVKCPGGVESDMEVHGRGGM